MVACIGDCSAVGPPPDMILSMPPPPLPSFLLPRSAIVALSNNDSQPCFAAFMCEPNPRPRESGIELIELTGKGQIALEDSWLFILVSCCVGVLLLGALLAFVLMKCRDYNYSYQETNIKQTTMQALGEPSKSNPFLSGGMLYPCTTNNRETIQHQMANDNRLLWATLTPHGTRHFVQDFPLGQDGNYEIVDYKPKCHTMGREQVVKRTPIKSFDNNGFVDYDYEDPTPLMDSYHDDLDSGYQEPHEVIGTLTRCSPRPLVSSPTRIENPNIPPLNINPHQQRSNQMTGTLNKKGTLSRRISDASSYGAPM
ncbi:uncharacterized protein LOC129618996 [Condylostylus longicornis]|uniref:uncharacterized protein LOC129618996 n=1 Tax=Condylostylus longicornis TaxID=2530218 RepID=UPI00244DAFAA|nr:uncharacterized protein LOC129618996 [Condylostylus longicornis]